MTGNCQIPLFDFRMSRVTGFLETLESELLAIGNFCDVSVLFSLLGKRGFFVSFFPSYSSHDSFFFFYWAFWIFRVILGF